jgi:hypothetical protein
VLTTHHPLSAKVGINFSDERTQATEFVCLMARHAVSFLSIFGWKQNKAKIEKRFNIFSDFRNRIFTHELSKAELLQKSYKNCNIMDTILDQKKTLWP